MKKVLLIAAVAVFGFTANAQDISFGAKAGLNMANLGGDAEGDMKMGLHIGGVVEIAISDQFSFAPELLFSMQGSKQEWSEDTGFGTIEVEEKINLNYINIPLMAKYYVAEGFSLEAGPQIGLLMSAKSEIEASFDGDTESGSEDIKDALKGLDLGLNVGAGYKLDNGLFFQARYNVGLSNIVDEGGDDFKMTNSVIQVSVGFMFN